MQPPAWHVHCTFLARGIQLLQDAFDSPSMRRWNKPRVVALVQEPQTTMSDALDHRAIVGTSLFRDNAEHHSFFAANLDSSVFQWRGLGLVLGSAIKSASRPGNARRNSLNLLPFRRIGNGPLDSSRTPIPFGTASRILSSPDPSRRTCSYRSQIAMFLARTCSTRSSYGAVVSSTIPQCCSTRQNQF